MYLWMHCGDRKLSSESGERRRECSPILLSCWMIVSTLVEMACESSLMVGIWGIWGWGIFCWVFIGFPLLFWVDFLSGFKNFTEGRLFL